MLELCMYLLECLYGLAEKLISGACVAAGVAIGRATRRRKEPESAAAPAESLT